MSCPCELTKEEVKDLDQRDRVPLVGGLCQNPFTKPDGTLGICGKPLGAHPCAPSAVPACPDAPVESLAMAKLSLVQKPTQTTPKGQYAASSFCNHVPFGFGYLPMLTRFEPSYQVRPQFQTLTYNLVPNAEDVRNAPPLRISGELPGFQSRGETEAGGITEKTLSALQHFDCFVGNGQKWFSSRGLSVGLAKDNSYNDIHVSFDGLHILECENKGAESSLLPALAQSATSATNFCVSLMASGVPIEHCVVSVMANTGMNMCFGATIMLDESFPTYVPLSKQLDLLDEYESKVASAYVQKAKQHGLFVSRLPRNSKRPVAEMRLDLERYFVKRLTEEVFARGLGLFAPTGASIRDVQNGLDHMIRCLNRLFHSEARDIVEYPLSVRTPESYSNEVDSICNYFELIYRNLNHLGFITGTPNRLKSSKVYEAFVIELRRVVGLVHRAGVIHVDLYASNIMWKLLKDGNVIIKIVDWDVSHCLDEETFSPKIKALLQDRVYAYAGQPVRFGEDHDNLYLSVFDMPLEERHFNYWEGLASGVKALIDDSFQRLMQDWTSRLKG